MEPFIINQLKEFNKTLSLKELLYSKRKKSWLLIIGILLLIALISYGFYWDIFFEYYNFNTPPVEIRLFLFLIPSGLLILYYDNKKSIILNNYHSEFKHDQSSIPVIDRIRVHQLREFIKEKNINYSTLPTIIAILEQEEKRISWNLSTTKNLSILLLTILLTNVITSIQNYTFYKDISFIDSLSIYKPITGIFTSMILLSAVLEYIYIKTWPQSSNQRLISNLNTIWVDYLNMQNTNQQKKFNG